MIETELWLSFVSLLRSYAAAASLHAGEVRVTTNENAVTISNGNAQLAMTFDAESSEVSWRKSPPAGAAVTGTFAIQHDGTAGMDGVTKDLDHAAIDFIASVTERAEGGSR